MPAPDATALAAQMGAETDELLRLRKHALLRTFADPRATAETWPVAEQAPNGEPDRGQRQGAGPAATS